MSGDRATPCTAPEGMPTLCSVASQAGQSRGQAEDAPWGNVMHAVPPTFPSATVLHITSSCVPPTKPRANVFGSMPRNRTVVKGTSPRGQPKHCQELFLPAAPSASLLQCPRCLHPHCYAISGSLIFIDLVGTSVSSVLLQRAFSPTPTTS